MAETTALGIAQSSDGQGVTPITHRRIIGAEWPNVGIVSGLEVSGRADLSYDVSAGCAVCSRGGSDGSTMAYWEGGAAGPVSSGDPANPRIDVVWIRANDLQQGDPDNLVHVGVTEGTPSPSPVAPSVPAGCTPLIENVMPAGATSTSSALENSLRKYAIPFGASLGLLGRSVLNYEGPGDYGDGGKDYFELSTQFTVPTDRLVEFRFAACVCAASAQDPNQPTGDAGDTSAWYVGIQLDGVDVVGGGGQFQVSRAWEPVSLSVVTEVKAGTHVARTRNHRVGWGNNVYFVCHTDATQTYQGKTLEIWDRGVSS